jgi:hypothetical protein
LSLRQSNKKLYKNVTTNNYPKVFNLSIFDPLSCLDKCLQWVAENKSKIWSLNILSSVWLIQFQRDIQAHMILFSWVMAHYPIVILEYLEVKPREVTEWSTQCLQCKSQEPRWRYLAICEIKIKNTKASHCQFCHCHNSCARILGSAM